MRDNDLPYLAIQAVPEAEGGVMPTRLLRDWTDSEPVNGLTDGAEKFFTRLIMKADDFGRYHASPKLLRPALFPLQLDRVREADLDRWIAECVKASLVRRYTSGGKDVVEIVKFNQRKRAEASKFPNPDGQMPVTCPSSDCHPRTYSEAKADAETKADAVPAAKDSAVETLDAAKLYAAEIGLPATEAERFWDYFTSNGWKVGGRAPMKDRRAAMRNWLRNYKERNGSAPHRTTPAAPDRNAGTYNKASDYAGFKQQR